MTFDLQNLYEPRFDGKVIVPDEALALKPNQKVRISIEPIETDPSPAPRRTEFRDLIGLGLRSPQNPNPRFSNDDALWERSPGEGPDQRPAE